MTEKKPRMPSIDSRLFRPSGWSPPASSEQELSLHFSSLEPEQQRIVLAGALPSLKAATDFANQCLLFYTADQSPIPVLGSHWMPWGKKDGIALFMRSMLPHVESEIREFLAPWLAFMQNLEEVNQAGAAVLAAFFNQPVPQSEGEFQILQEHVERYRGAYGAVWVHLSNFQPLIQRLRETSSGMQQCLPALDKLLQALRPQAQPGNPQVELINQKVKDQIDASRAVFSHSERSKCWTRL